MNPIINCIDKINFGYYSKRNEIVKSDEEKSRLSGAFTENPVW